jgi:hypothetical protein
MNVGAVTAYRIKSCCGALVAIGTSRHFAAPQNLVAFGLKQTLTNHCSSYVFGPSTLPSTIRRASAKASAGVEHGIVAASFSPSSSYLVTMTRPGE